MDRANVIEKIQSDMKTSDEGFTRQIIKHLKDLYESGKSVKRIVDVDERPIDLAELNAVDVIFLASKKNLMDLAAKREGVVTAATGIPSTAAFPSPAANNFSSLQNATPTPANSASTQLGNTPSPAIPWTTFPSNPSLAAASPATTGNVPSLATSSISAAPSKNKTPFMTGMSSSSTASIGNSPTPTIKTLSTPTAATGTVTAAEIVQVSITGFDGSADSVQQKLINEFIDQSDIVNIYSRDDPDSVEIIIKSKPIADSFISNLETLKQEFGIGLTVKSQKPEVSGQTYTVSIRHFPLDKLKAATTHVQSIIDKTGKVQVTKSTKNTKFADYIFVDFKTEKDAKAFESSDMEKLFGIKGLSAMYLDKSRNARSMPSFSAATATLNPTSSFRIPIATSRKNPLSATSTSTPPSGSSKISSASSHARIPITPSTPSLSTTHPPNKNNGSSATSTSASASSKTSSAPTSLSTPSTVQASTTDRTPALGYVLKAKRQNVQPDANSFYTSIALFLAENKQLALPKYDADSIRREVAGLMANDQNFVTFIEEMLLDIEANITLPTRIKNKKTDDFKVLIERERTTDGFEEWLGKLDDYAILDNNQPPNDEAEIRLSRWKTLNSAKTSFLKRQKDPKSLPSDSMSKLCQSISNNVRTGRHSAIGFERKVMNKFLQEHLGTDMFTITMNNNQRQPSPLQALSKQLKRYRFKFQQAICIIQEQEQPEVFDIVRFERGGTHTLSTTSEELKQIKNIKDGDEDLLIIPASNSDTIAENVKTTEAILNSLFGKLQVESPPLDLVCEKTLELVTTLKRANDQNKAKISDTEKLLKDRKDLYPVLTKMTFDVVFSDTKGLKLISWSVWTCKQLLTHEEYTAFLEYCKNQQPNIMDDLKKHKVDTKMTMVVHNYLCLMGCLCVFESPKDLTFSECLTFSMDITETEAPENLKDSSLKGICTCLKVLTGPALIHLYKSNMVSLFEQLTRLCVLIESRGKITAVKTFLEKMLETLLNKNHKITKDSRREADLAVIPREFLDEKDIEFPVCGTVEAHELVDWLQDKPQAWLDAWSESVLRAKGLDKHVLTLFENITQNSSHRARGEITTGSPDEIVMQEDSVQIPERHATNESTTLLPDENIAQEDDSKMQDVDSKGVMSPEREIPLENMGNSCFMNAALQMVYRLMRKCSRIKSEVVQNSLQNDDDLAVLNEFIRLAQEMNQKDPEYDELGNLYNKIQERFHTSWDINKSFNDTKFSQRDVSQLLEKIFDEPRLAHCANITIERWSKCEYDNNESSQWLQNVPDSTSILILNPEGGEAVKFILSEMVDDYFREEPITHEKDFEMCEIDGLHSKTVTRRNTCTAVTETIILQLPRFVNDGKNTGKSSFEIDIDDFQIPILTKSTDLNSTMTNLLYRPIGFIAHKGKTLRSGHYTYFAREKSTNRWAELNDNQSEIHDHISSDISKSIYIILCERVKVP